MWPVKKFNKASVLFIVIGLVVSIIAMETVPVNDFQLSDEAAKSQSSDQDDQKDKGEATLAAQSAIALPLSLEFQIDPELFLLNIIPENEAEDTPNTLFSDVLTTQQKVLKILFRRIISPNAP